MALDLETAIKNFEAASTGEDVRARLYELLNILANADINVQYLNGKPQGEYVLHETVNTNIIDNLIKLYFKGYDTEPKTPSVKFIKSKDLDKLFTEVMTKLRGVSGSNTDQTLNTIEGYLTYIYNRMYSSDVHVGIKAAIESHDSLSHPGEKISIDETTSIMDYDQKILDIDDHSLKVEPLKITELGEHIYKAPEGKAYNPIVTAVPIKTGPLVATENGTYDDPSKYGYDAFSSVVARVPIENPNSSGSSYGGGSGGSSGSKLDSNYNLLDYAVTQNGEYSAASIDGGYDGFSSIDASEVSNYYVDPNKRFTVTFVDENGEKIKEVTDIHPNASVAKEDYPEAQVHTYTGDLWVFDGWDPEPINIISDLTCEPKFSRYTGFPTYKTSKIHGKYIEDTWEDICSNSGMRTKYGIGSIKVLYIPHCGFIRMQKVAENESESVSSWLSMDALGYFDETSGLTDGTVDGEPWTWNNSNFRNWLNTTFIENYLPKCIKNHLHSVDKFHLEDQNGTLIWGTTNDKIWIPSMKELNFYKSGEEVDGYPGIVIGDAGPCYEGTFTYFKGDGRGNGFGKSSLPVGNGGSLYGILRSIKGSQFPNPSMDDRYHALLPHPDDAEYEFYDSTTGETKTATNFDALDIDQKIIQHQHYSIPRLDYEKLYMDYPYDIPYGMRHWNYDWTGVPFSGANMSGGYGFSYYNTSVLRDNLYGSNNRRGFRVQTGMWTMGWNDGSGRILPGTLPTVDNGFIGGHIRLRFGFCLK